MAKTPKQVKLLKNAERDHPELFAYARKLWEAEGKMWDDLVLTAFEKPRYGDGKLLAFAIYPREVHEAFGRGERPNPYKWISGEVPVDYTEADFDGGYDLGDGWTSSGVSVVGE